MRAGRTAGSIIAFVFVTVCATTAFGQSAGVQRVQVTDPAALQAMGAAPNAQNVFRLVGGVAASEPQDFGTQDTFLILPAKAFMQRQDPSGAGDYNGGGIDNTMLEREPTGDTFWDAPIQLPSGVILKTAVVYAQDADAVNDIWGFVFETCAGNPPTSTELTGGSTKTTGSPGWTAFTVDIAPDVTIDNVNCHYTMRVRMDGTTANVLARVRVRFTRQVSPTPGFASFADVPVGHPFHRFVQALVASGVTGGCGGGNYCPDSPVTRGQMAVFLATALGLHWQ